MIEQFAKLRPTERRVFRDEIRERLIEDILGGKLIPGTRIVETRLAQQFGVSQAPVREALRDLALFGFVINSPFKGTEVKTIAASELLEIYPVRAALEGVAASAAASRIDDAALADMEELIGSMRKAAVRDNRLELAKADTAFHHAIIKASGNHVLDRVWQTMRLAITTDVTYAMAMPSIDEDLLIRLSESGKVVCIAEQNNGYILQNLLKVLYRRRKSAAPTNVMAINTLDRDGRPRFIHSGTYEELLGAFGLSAPQLASAIANRVEGATT